MRKVVSLGYAQDNGCEGKSYKIKLIDRAGNDSNNNPQNLNQQELKALLATHNESNISAPGSRFADEANCSKQNFSFDLNSTQSNRSVTESDDQVTESVTTDLTEQTSIEKRDADKFVLTVTTNVDYSNECSVEGQDSSEALNCDTSRQVDASNLPTDNNDHRNLARIDGNRIVVDEDKLDLSYQPAKYRTKNELSGKTQIDIAPN